MTTIHLPVLGEDIEKATVATWYVGIGDAVKKTDDVVEVVTDKATFNVASPADGIVKKIIVPPGEDAAVGAALAVLE